jgi:hypothetical protein
MLVDIWLSPNAWSSPLFQSSPHKLQCSGTLEYTSWYQKLSESGDRERYLA